MARTFINLSVQPLSVLAEDHIKLGESLVKKLRIPAGSPLTLQFGSFQREIRVISVSKQAGMKVSASLAEKAGLHEGLRLCLHYKPSSRTLQIGPLIGVLIRGLSSKVPEKPFGNITSFCREMTDACRQYGGMVFIFTPGPLQSFNSSVKGWVYDDGWKLKTLPVPDIVYNRLTSRIIENSDTIQHFMKEVKQRFGTKIFNERYLDKAEVFDALKKEADVRQYLPESYLYKNKALLASMLSRHSTVFLKPILGSLGKGIIRMRRNSNETYTCQFANSTGAPLQRTYPNFSRLMEGISGRIKSTRFLVQQGLQLISVSRAPVDFRALVQRDGTGVWSITSIVARIAGNQNFVSNLARGGRLSTVNAALAESDLPASLRQAVAEKLRKSALEIAKGVESQIEAHFAELGIDLAVDVRGGVYLLEINSKPSKEDNSPLTAEPGSIRPSVKRVVQYSRFLAKF